MDLLKIIAEWRAELVELDHEIRVLEKLAGVSKSGEPAKRKKRRWTLSAETRQKMVSVRVTPIEG